MIVDAVRVDGCGSKKAPFDATPVDNRAVLELLVRLESAGPDIVEIEHRFAFSGAPDPLLGQGQ